MAASADRGGAGLSRGAGRPIVIKADGLAAGKGVTVAMDMETARAAVADIFSGKFGGAECVIEEFLEGEEASFFVLTDGRNALPLATAQDHKRVGDGDTGPNTGGMGAYSPAPCMTQALCDEALETIVKPTIRALAGMGHPYVGVLYAGLILTKDGPKLIEYNCRFGDPECQVLMMRLKDDLVTLLLACCDGTLDKVTARWFDEVALTVVMCARGYPGDVTRRAPKSAASKVLRPWRALKSSMLARRRKMVRSLPPVAAY
jgi:phosphoribosylamine---glycine ligase